MILRDTERKPLSNNPLVETICQVRFPRILSIEESSPAGFQDVIRKTYPQYMLVKENANKGTPNETNVNNHNFISADGKWKINLTSSFFALSTKGYVSWENFARRFDQPFASFIQIYQPSYFERVGLRYINALSRQALGYESEPWSELINSAYLGVLGHEDVQETAVVRMQTTTDLMLPGPLRAHVVAGPGQVSNPTPPSHTETRFILDIDMGSAGQVPIPKCAETLQNLHEYAGKLFRGALTDKALDAME